MEITEYRSCSWWKGGLKQEEMQDLAKKIFAMGKIKKAFHQGYGTNCPDQTHGDEWINVLDGGVAYDVECDGLPVSFVIHMTGFEVTEIIEKIKR